MRDPMAPESAVLLSGASIIDLDGTVLVQLALFLLSLFVLRRLLFRPWLRLMEVRQQATVGTRHEAEKLMAQAQAMSARVDKEMQRVRQVAHLEAERLRQQSAEKASLVVARARKDYEEHTAEAAARLRDEADEARRGLHQSEAELARQLVSQMLGREMNGAQ